MGFIRSVLSFARDVLEVVRRPPTPLGLRDSSVTPPAEPSHARVTPPPAPPTVPPTVAPVVAPPRPRPVVPAYEPFNREYWRAQPLTFLPDGMLGRYIGKSRDQVRNARERLRLIPGNTYGSGGDRFPRDANAWSPWVAAWGQAGVREWLVRHADEALIEQFDKHMRIVAARQTVETSIERRRRITAADEAVAARDALGHLAPRVKPEKV